MRLKLIVVLSSAWLATVASAEEDQQPADAGGGSNVAPREIVRRITPAAPTPGSGSARSELNDDPPFDTVQILGDANLAAGSLTGSDGATVATGAAGIFASTDKYSILAAFTFGSVGASTETTHADYISFLRTPTSAVGAQVQLRALYPVANQGWLRLGPGMNLKANGTEFKAGPRTQEIGMVQIDGSLAMSMKLDKSKDDLFFIAEAGLGLRFWNKPSKEFLDAIDINTDSHVFFGPRVVAAVSIGRIHVGVELTRFWGGALDQYKEFSVLPYVGIDGGLDIVKPDDGGTADDSCSGNGSDGQTVPGRSTAKKHGHPFKDRAMRSIPALPLR